MPKTSNPDALTFAQATELLAARRDMAPAPKRGAFGRSRAVKTDGGAEDDGKEDDGKKTTAQRHRQEDRIVTVLEPGARSL